MDNTKANGLQEANEFHIRGLDISGKLRTVLIFSSDLSSALKKAERLGFAECKRVAPPKKKKWLVRAKRPILLTLFLGGLCFVLFQRFINPPDMKARLQSWDLALTENRSEELLNDFGSPVNLRFSNIRYRELPRRKGFLLLQNFFGQKHLVGLKHSWQSDIVEEGWSDDFYRVEVTHQIRRISENGRSRVSPVSVVYHWKRDGLSWSIQEFQSSDVDG